MTTKKGEPSANQTGNRGTGHKNISIIGAQRYDVKLRFNSVHYRKSFSWTRCSKEQALANAITWRDEVTAGKIKPPVAQRASLEVYQGSWEPYGDNFRVIDGMLCGTMRMMFTTGVLFGLTDLMYRGRFCFDTKNNAALFLKEWDGKSYPVVGEDGCMAIKGEL